MLSLSLERNLQPTAAALQQAGLLDDADGETARPSKLRVRHLAASLEARTPTLTLTLPLTLTLILTLTLT